VRFPLFFFSFCVLVCDVDDERRDEFRMTNSHRESGRFWLVDVNLFRMIRSRSRLDGSIPRQRSSAAEGIFGFLGLDDVGVDGRVVAGSRRPGQIFRVAADIRPDGERVRGGRRFVGDARSDQPRHVVRTRRRNRVLFPESCPAAHGVDGSVRFVGRVNLLVRVLRRRRSFEGGEFTMALFHRESVETLLASSGDGGVDEIFGSRDVSAFAEL